MSILDKLADPPEASKKVQMTIPLDVNLKQFLIYMGEKTNRTPTVFAREVLELIKNEELSDPALKAEFIQWKAERNKKYNSKRDDSEQDNSEQDNSGQDDSEQDDSEQDDID